MAEELVLEDPEEIPAKTKNTYKVVSLNMNHEMVTPASPEPGLMVIQLVDNLGGYFTHQYTGKAAVDYIKYINTANFTTKSLHKRILEKLSNDGVLPGTVQGTPDPPAIQLESKDESRSESAKNGNSD